MSNRKKSDSKSIFEKKGFYTALYSCIAIVLVAAVGISYRSLWNASDEAGVYVPAPSTKVVEEKAANSQWASSSGANTASNPQEPASTVVEEGNIADILVASTQSSTSAANNETKAQTEAAQNSTAANEANQANAQNEANEAEQVIAVSSNTQVPLELEAATENQPISEKTEQSENSVENSAKAPEAGFENEETSALADPVFNTFSGNEDMVWPVLGEIVMEFSPDKLVYDKTLDQYRANDTICIAANIGEQVKASADGVVRSITNTREYGNTIVIEHGNGWFTTYSQLQDGILVEEGDVVTKNQVIGGVGSPSIYSVLLGSHLSFKVVKDNSAVDPSLVLALN